MILACCADHGDEDADDDSEMCCVFLAQTNQPCEFSPNACIPCFCLPLLLFMAMTAKYDRRTPSSKRTDPSAPPLGSLLQWWTSRSSPFDGYADATDRTCVTRPCTTASASRPAGIQSTRHTNWYFRSTMRAAEINKLQTASIVLPQLPTPFVPDQQPPCPPAALNQPLAHECCTVKRSRWSTLTFHRHPRHNSMIVSYSHTIRRALFFFFSP